LWLDKEPTADEVMTAFDGLKEKLTSDEVVFCGFGEPTDALEALIECAKRFKAMGFRLRLNTNGLGSADNGHDVAKELVIFDTVSVSLNQCDGQKYAAVTRSKYGEKALSHVLEFAAACKTVGINTVFTVVDTITKSDIQKCRTIAKDMGIALRVRKYVPDNYGDK
ncbi:MAG: TatD family nuclease-associated radical SAM protein, partial [Clostridiales bacterium]|nr:TatD family nuclease-associated radical SAM protein [Clostridiales bacterium]